MQASQQPQQPLTPVKEGQEGTLTRVQELQALQHRIAELREKEPSPEEVPNGSNGGSPATCSLEKIQILKQKERYLWNLLLLQLEI